MKIVQDAGQMSALSHLLRGGLKKIGFVPTMGALHAGHLALVQKALEKSDVVVASVYLNPLQFAPGEDLGRYPRDLEGDMQKLEEAGCHIAFTPHDLYPQGAVTTVAVDGPLVSTYEGALRPAHFRGVTTVVAKLFNIVRPDLAVFGRKDAQQVAVIRRMTEDLYCGVQIVVHDIVRDTDGLALSSRNVFLSPEQRLQALSLWRALEAARQAAQAGEDYATVVKVMARTLSPAVQPDYADVVDQHTFISAAESQPKHPLAIIAARVGATRLIDNIPLPVSAPETARR